MTEPQVELLIPVVPVANLSRAAEVYGRLGFIAWVLQLAADQPRLGSMRQGAVELFLTEHHVAPPGTVVYANVTGLDALAARAQTSGGEPHLRRSNPVFLRDSSARDTQGLGDQEAS